MYKTWADLTEDERGCIRRQFQGYDDGDLAVYLWSEQEDGSWDMDVA